MQRLRSYSGEDSRASAACGVWHSKVESSLEQCCMQRECLGLDGQEQIADISQALMSALTHARYCDGKVWRVV